MLLDGRAQPTGIKKRGSDTTLLLCFNAYYDMVRFKLIKMAGGDKWVRLLDTNQPDADESSAFKLGHDYDVTGPLGGDLQAAGEGEEVGAPAIQR